MDFQLHLETETVEHCYPSKPLCAAPDEPVRSVLRLLQREKTGAAMICVEGKLVGIFTERDALRLLADGGSLDGPVSNVMRDLERTVVRVRKRNGGRAANMAAALLSPADGIVRRASDADQRGMVDGFDVALGAAL